MPELRAAFGLAADGDHVATVGANRKLLVFPLAELPELGRGAGPARTKVARRPF